ncbi:MAG: ASPIC/UnbV domain-containing protein, partial [Chitinophagales bacterium]|nr:ASPIC/UnbV domain-containing protein [Chitinophagales bacterium]
FVHHFPSFANLIGSRSTSNADYDNDGDLDLFINGTNSNQRGLYRNELNNGNWINISLEGTASNRSAIGAKVRIKATINGHSHWQRRDISSQNAFCGQNDLRVHFGLGDASIIDSILIEWPLGLKEVYTNITSNQFLNYTEGAITTTSPLIKEAFSLNVFPNPANSEVNISYSIKDSNQIIRFRLFDASMQFVKEIDNGVQFKGTHHLTLDTSDWPTGSYLLVCENGGIEITKKLIILH